MSCIEAVSDESGGIYPPTGVLISRPSISDDPRAQGTEGAGFEHGENLTELGGGNIANKIKLERIRSNSKLKELTLAGASAVLSALVTRVALGKKKRRRMPTGRS